MTTPTARGYARSREQVAALLTGLDLVQPGLVWVPEWRPDADTELTGDPGRSVVYGAVARKP